MGLEDCKYFIAKVGRDSITDCLTGLCKSISKYLYTPMPENITIDNFFSAFPEGDRKLSGRGFFVQARVKPPTGMGFNGGRVGIGYNFESIEEPYGKLQVTVFDNGENVPEEFFEKIYTTLKTSALEKGLEILKEIKCKEV